MPTQTKENYLKAAYFLAQKGSDITITDLSKVMEVSTPTVNNMVKKMEKKGWVLYQKYKPILLTDQGHKEAALIVRKHRLAEMYLTQIMGFGWEEVHEIAEEMEHLPTESLFDRMDEILGFPTTDPHGSPIPNKDGVIAIKELINLSELKEGAK
jgi:DtxR family Mn-dependent transcriptional regulator